MPSKKPNVIWIFSDQQPGYSLGFAGDSNARTPNLDILSRQGISFPNAVAGFPLCCPFRGSLITGLYPHHCVPGHEYPLDPAHGTIADVFNDQGYDTAYFGKWHLDGHKERDGRGAKHVVPAERRGRFKTWFGFENNNSQYDSWIHGDVGTDAVHYRLPGYETDELTTLLLDYLGGKAAEESDPFFAVLSVQPPHDPYVAPPEYMRRYNAQDLTLRQNVPGVPRIEEKARQELQGMYAMADNLDFNVGRIVSALRKSEQLENTHILYFSDHGDMHGSHGQFKKMTCYQESIHIPFIIAGEQPQHYNHRGVGRALAPLNHVDIAPTTLGLCGIDKADWMEGTDYSGYRIKDRPAAEEPGSAYLQSVIPTGHGDSVNKPWRGVVTDDGWKYTCFENVSWAMFNLSEDQYEQVNLAHNSKYRAERKKLIGLLNSWIDQTGDAFPVPED
jgi:arylsulfatase A-like enzyme